MLIIFWFDNEVVLGPEDHGTETGMLSMDSLGGDSILHRLNLREARGTPPASPAAEMVKEIQDL